jgi:hypothetical protein
MCALAAASGIRSGSRLDLKSIDTSWIIQWHLNQITAATGLNDSGRHAHEPRTSKERGRRRLRCAKLSATQLKLQQITTKLAETLEISGNTASWATPATRPIGIFILVCSTGLTS